MKNSFHILLLVSFVVPFSCKQKDPEPKYRISSSAYKLDISNAEFLVVLPLATDYYSYSSYALHKVKTDGTLEEVSFFSVDQKKLTQSFYPYSLGITDRYFLTTNNENQTCLIRRSDGVIYVARSDEYSMPYHSNSSTGIIKTMTDANGNIYYLGYNSGGTHYVYKISTSSSDFMKISRYSPIDYDVKDFEVDSRGNLLYVHTFDFYTDGYRLMKADGSDSDVTAFSGMTLGKDDHFYVSQIPGFSSSLDIIKYTIDNSLAVSTTNLGTFPNAIFDTDYKAYNGNNTIFTYENRITQLNPDNGSVVNFLSYATTVSDISYSSADLFLVGYDYSYYNNVVYKVPGGTYSPSSFPLPPDEYDVRRVVASSNGTLLVTATRKSDYQMVLVRVDNTGTISVLKENFDMYSVCLWKID